MLSVDDCQSVLNDESAPGVRYSRAEAKRSREVLYRLARIYLDHQHAPFSDDDSPSDHEEGPALQPRLNE